MPSRKRRLREMPSSDPRHPPGCDPAAKETIPSSSLELFPKESPQLSPDAADRRYGATRGPKRRP